MHLKIPFSIVFVLFTISCLAQTIPAERIVDWSKAGLLSEIANPDVVLDVIEQGGDNTGLAPNDGLIQSLIQSNSDNPFILFFPKGEYLFNESIVLPSNCIIRGESAATTSFVFDLGGAGHLFRMQGTADKTKHFVQTKLSKGIDKCWLQTAAPFQTGDLVQIISEDAALVYSDWAIHSTGQMLSIEQNINTEVQFQTALRRAYPLTEQAYLKKINPIVNTGIEQIRILRMDATETMTSHIFIDYARNCWVNCVESYTANFAHVDIRRSQHIEVEGCYFKEAHKHGNGGKAYGVVLHFAASDCLVHNNSFERLRHSMLLQAGANGNVLSYNYSQNPYWSGVMLPSNSAGDLVLHGNYVYANLLEGNTIQNIVIDNSHGENGPYNTFFRNRAELYGLFMNTKPASNRQNFIGNEITNTGILLGFYNLAGKGHFEYGNQVQNDVVPTGTTDVSFNSLYLDAAPDFWDATVFPPIGLPHSLNANSIPAQIRTLSQQLTPCATETMVHSDKLVDTILQIYPNPVKDVVYIKSNNPAIQIEALELVDAQGRLVLQKKRKSKLNLKRLESGIYFLKIHLSNSEVQIKKLLHF